MKRDMDLCREIHLAIEASPEAVGLGFIQLGDDNRDPQEVSYHVLLLRDARLLEAEDMSNSGDGLVMLPKRLTYAGHEFIEASRKQTLWQKAKSLTLEKTGGLSFDVLKAVLLKLATDSVLGGGS